MMAQQFAQTGRLFSFSLKRDWKKILGWFIGVILFVFIGIFAYAELFTDPNEREAMAMAMSNPAMEAIFGPVIGADNYTIGAMYSHTMTILSLCLVAIMSILLVASNTKSEEEEGILELLRALPIGRLSHTTVSLLLLGVTNLIISIGTALVLYEFGDSSVGLEGSILTGLMYGSIGMFFGAVTLLMGQFSTSVRNTMMWSFGVLGVAYLLRIIGDSGNELFSWLSPLGLLYRTEPFVENNWSPIFILALATLLVFILALALQRKRDIGAGLLTEKPGKRDASTVLKTSGGFALNLLKTSLIVWFIALLLLGVTYGSVIGDVEGLLGDNEMIEQIIVSDPSMNIVEQFLGMIIGLLSIFAAIPAIQAFLRLKSEETKGRLDNILTGTYSRTKILTTFLIISLVTSVVMQLAQLLAIGGAAVLMDFDVSVPNVLTTGLAYLPAIWLSLGIAVLFYGWLPKLTNLVWGYLGLAFVILYFGDLFDLPDWVMNLSAFHHMPATPQAEVDWTILLLLTGIAAVLIILGALGFRRRDIAE